MRTPASLLVCLLVACATGDALEPEPRRVAPTPPLTPTPTAKPAPPIDDAPPEPASEPPAPHAAAPAQSSTSTSPPTPIGATGSDAELFYQAEAMLANHDKQAMRRQLLALIQQHPTSPFVPRSYMLFADAMFEDGNMDLARQLYEKVMAYPDSDVAAYAQYRSAWCRLNLQDDAEALAAFTGAARRARQQNTDHGRLMVRVSLLDSTLAYLRVARLDRAVEFYTPLTRGTAVPLDDVLRRLASAAVDTDRSDELARVCKAAGMPGWCAAPLDR